MAADRNLKVVVTGHTDNVGSEEVNMKYGKDRAEVLKALMVKRGAPAANITTVSKGESEPIVENDTEEHRYMNRRAVITLK
jgi:OOP family OmpA-OmpF porin